MTQEQTQEFQTDVPNPYNPADIDIEDGSYDLSNVVTIREFQFLSNKKLREYYAFLLEEQRVLANQEAASDEDSYRLLDEWEVLSLEVEQVQKELKRRQK